MSTLTKNQPDVKTLEDQLNQLIQSGAILEALERFYADDVIMQENTDAPKIGKDVCRQAERDFLDAVEQFHSARLLGNAVNGDTSYSEWEFDATYKGAGRIKLTQVAARRWKDGLIVHERFYYKKG
jgi:ketosteroid isomerase-like protein